MSLTLNISEEERASILTAFSNPVPRAYEKLYGRPYQYDKDDEAPATLPAQVLGRTRLSDVVRSDFDPGEESHDLWGRPRPKHAEFMKNLANALAEAMMPDLSATVPVIHNPDGYPNEREEAFQRISQLDAEKLAMRLMKEPKPIYNWMQHITWAPEEREFTDSDFLTFHELGVTARGFNDWVVLEVQLLEPRDSLVAMMDDLLNALGDCKSIEDYLPIVLYMFWVAADLRMLVPEQRPMGEEGLAGKLLRNYVATLLLVESTR